MRWLAQACPRMVRNASASSSPASGAAGVLEGDEAVRTSRAPASATRQEASLEVIPFIEVEVEGQLARQSVVRRSRIPGLRRV